MQIFCIFRLAFLRFTFHRYLNPFKEDIPSKILSGPRNQYDIDAIFIKISLRKTKWFLCGTYHRFSQNDRYYFYELRK